MWFILRQTHFKLEVKEREREREREREQKYLGPSRVPYLLQRM